MPRLRVANLADHPLLLLDGGELVGAKQDRVLNMTVLVPARTEIIIPVSCVERGRWHYRQKHLVAGGRAATSPQMFGRISLAGRVSRAAAF